MEGLKIKNASLGTGSLSWKGGKAVSRLKRTIALLALAVLVVGCAQAPVMPPRGIIFSEQKAPMFSGSATGSKTGIAIAYSAFGLVGWGDCSIETAAKAGGITQIRHVDYLSKNVLGYQEFTTIVKGE
jgi:hypothetical protein